MINNVATGKVVCVIPMPNDGAEIERKRARICREGVFVLYVRWGINNFVIYIYIYTLGGLFKGLLRTTLFIVSKKIRCTGSRIFIFYCREQTRIYFRLLNSLCNMLLQLRLVFLYLPIQSRFVVNTFRKCVQFQQNKTEKECFGENSTHFSNWLKIYDG